MLPALAATGPIASSPILAKAVGAIPDSTLLKVIFGPLYDLYNCYQAIIKSRRVESRYVIQAIVVILGLVAGIVVPIVSPVYLNWLNDFLQATTANAFLTFYFSAWLFAYPSSGIAQATVFLYLLSKYGDDKYYLNKERLNFLARGLGVRDEDVLAIFVFLRDSLAAGKTVIHSKSGNLTDVLDTFMYGSTMGVMEHYHRHIGFYEAYLLQNGDVNILNDDVRMTSLAEIYKVSPETLRAVLQYCLYGIEQHYDTVGSRPEDFSEVIAKILTGNLSGTMAFIRMYSLQIEQSQGLSALQQQNAQAAARLTAYKRERSPRASLPPTPRETKLPPPPIATQGERQAGAKTPTPTPTPARPVEVEEEKRGDQRPSINSWSETEEDIVDLETMAKVLVRLKRGKGMRRPKTAASDDIISRHASHEVVDENTGITDKGIDVLIEYFRQQSLEASRELEKMPPLPSRTATAMVETPVLPVQSVYETSSVPLDPIARRSSIRTSGGLFFAAAAPPNAGALGAAMVMAPAPNEGVRSGQLRTRRLGSFRRVSEEDVWRQAPPAPAEVGPGKIPSRRLDPTPQPRDSSDRRTPSAVDLTLAGQAAQRLISITERASRGLSPADLEQGPVETATPSPPTPAASSPSTPKPPLG